MRALTASKIVTSSPSVSNVDDGKIVAATAPNLLGTDIKALKDKTGKVFGEEVFKAGKRRQVHRGSATCSRARAKTEPMQKVSFVTKVG